MHGRGQTPVGGRLHPSEFEVFELHHGLEHRPKRFWPEGRLHVIDVQRALLERGVAGGKHMRKSTQALVPDREVVQFQLNQRWKPHPSENTHAAISNNLAEK